MVEQPHTADKTMAYSDFKHCFSTNLIQSRR